MQTFCGFLHWSCISVVNNRTLFLMQNNSALIGNDVVCLFAQLTTLILTPIEVLTLAMPFPFASTMSPLPIFTSKLKISLSSFDFCKLSNDWYIRPLSISLLMLIPILLSIRKHDATKSYIFQDSFSVELLLCYFTCETVFLDLHTFVMGVCFLNIRLVAFGLHQKIT